VFPFAKIAKRNPHNPVFTTFKKRKKKNRERLITAVTQKRENVTPSATRNCFN